MFVLPLGTPYACCSIGWRGLCFCQRSRPVIFLLRASCICRGWERSSCWGSIQAGRWLASGDSARQAWTPLMADVEMAVRGSCRALRRGRESGQCIMLEPLHSYQDHSLRGGLQSAMLSFFPLRLVSFRSFSFPSRPRSVHGLLFTWVQSGHMALLSRPH